MRERWSLLLKLTAFFIVQFWLMIVNHYSLRGQLVGLPATAVVGSSAIVLLSALIVIVRRPTSHSPIESSSPQSERVTLAFLILGFLLTGLLLPVSEKPLAGLLLMLALCLLIFIALLSLILLPLQLLILLFSGEQVNSTTTNMSQIDLVIGTLIGILLTCITIVKFFNLFVFLVNRAALPKRLERGAYILQAIGLILVLAFFLGQLQDFRLGAHLRCSKPYLSPSGQRAIVVEDYEEFGGDAYYSHAYLDGLIFRKDLGNVGKGSVCSQQQLTFNWSADEWQVDWEKLLP